MILAMIIDDSRSSLLHLKQLLEDVGSVDGRTFENPDHALETAARERFDRNCSRPLGRYEVAGGGERPDFWVDDGLVM